MFHGLEAEELEDSDAVVPAPVGPPSLGPFRRLNLELGCTYAATHDRLGLKVTVQVVRPMRREDRERVIHGIRIVQQYRSNPFIHRLLWITQRGDDLHLITEYPEDSLQTAVNRLGPLDLGRTTRLFTQVLIAVSALHANHTVHRNLTLRTILMCGGVAKLSGFDWVNQFEDEATHQLLEQSLHYCAPEIVNNLDVTKYDRTKSDMWALGCILYALVCGELPFVGECRDTIAEEICVGGPYFPPGMDSEVSECIQALLHPDPSKRPSALQLLRSSWFELEYEHVMGDTHKKIPSLLVDDEMSECGFPQDHIAASRNDSEYNLPSAERYLVEDRLKRSDESIVPLVPNDPYVVPVVASSRAVPEPHHTTDAVPDVGVPDDLDDFEVPNVGRCLRRRSSDVTADTVFGSNTTRTVKPVVCQSGTPWLHPPGAVWRPHY